MIRKPNFKLNWKYALGELVLIFMGISLAIWFNNWNDQRKRNRLEKEILIQIYNDVRANQDDLLSDLDKLIFGVKSHQNITKYFAEDRPYVDSMCFDFHWITKDEYVFPIKGGYENLKANGLNLVKNDSILSLIQLTFEFAYPRISRDTPFYPDLTDHFFPYYQTHFVPNEDVNLVFERTTPLRYWRFPYISNFGGAPQVTHIGYIPLDYEALKKDTQFKMLMHQADEYRNGKVKQYLNVRSLLELLKQQIEVELKDELNKASEEATDTPD